MKFTVQDVIHSMEAWAPGSWAYDWDNVGLALGEPNQPVTKVVTCLSVNRQVLDCAVAGRAELIVSHHPLIFKAPKTLRSDYPQNTLILDLAKAGIAAFSAHTNLDVAPGGVNHVLADLLGIQEQRPLIPAPQAQQVKVVVFVPDTHLDAVRDAVAEAGAGIIGDYTHCTYSSPGTGTFRAGEGANPFVGEVGSLHQEDERRMEVLVPKHRLGKALRALTKAHPYEEPAYDVYPLAGGDPEVGLGRRGVLESPMTLEAFSGVVQTRLNLTHIRVVGDPEKKVKRVAVLGGSGGGEAFRMAPDIDVYVTGDIKYHEAEVAQQKGLALIDAGHAGTENPIVPVLAAYLESRHRGLQAIPCREADYFSARVGAQGEA
jgi:dinuclear metal center YbgI/SA1388 family protein